MPDYTTGQDLGREWRTFMDQHDRRWGASCSKKTGLPCQLLEPQFIAPLEVPHEHIKVNPNDSREIKIDYGSWIESIERGHRQWHEMVEKWVIELGIEGTIQQSIDNPPAQILKLVGPRSTRRTEPVLAAKAGNLWVLGLSTVVPEKAVKFFPALFEEAHEAHVVADPFQADEVVPDPFADEPKKAEVVEKTNGVAEDLGNGSWVVDGMKYPDWANPKDGWMLSSKELVPRGGLEKEDYRALAQEQEKALHVQE